MPLHVCAVSGGRADFGLLLPPLRLMRADPAFVVSLVLTGQHLVAGASDARAVAETGKLGRVVAVDMGLAGDDAASIARAAGRGLGGVADALASLAPDLVLVLGDRYEILCAALAATLARIPVAHIAGGDLTAGAMDDAFRHAITVMAHLHFVTNADAARRVRQLGELPERIHLAGSPGIDQVLAAPEMSREAFFAASEFVPGRHNLLVTFHPVTRAFDSTGQVAELVAALAARDADTAILVTGSNADPEGDTVGAALRQFAEGRRNARYVASLGSALYVNALRHMDVMVGNSSSGLLEAPTFALPAVNIGTRQDGRPMAASVFNCAPERAAIGRAIDDALSAGRRPVTNPFGDGRASERIVAVLRSISDPKALLNKRFAELAA